MQLTVGKSSILKELNLIQGVVEKKSTIPVLSNLLLEAKDGGLSIKATDLDVSISTRCEVEIKKEGAICVQAKKLFEIVRALPDAEIEIKRGENEQVQLICQRSRFKMLGLAKENFPEIQTFDGPAVVIPADIFRSFINRTIFAITSEESRYALNGAKFELSDKSLRMVATDGHRLSFIEKQFEVGGGEGKIDMLIPKKTLGELVRLCSESNDAVEFGHDQNHLFFRVGKRLLISRTISGQFPNYELVLPKENINHIVLESNQVSAAVKRVALMADERSHAVKFEIKDRQLNITSQAAEIGEAGESLPIEYSGPDISIGFNAQYVLDFFNVIDEGQVQFEFNDGSSKAEVRSLAEDQWNFRYIIMPMRL